MKQPIIKCVLVMLYGLLILPTKSSCVTYQDVESTFLTASHFWDFDQQLSKIKDRKSNIKVSLHGDIVASKSPVNNGIFLNGTESAWVDLKLQSGQSPCLTDPFSCNQLTVASLIKITNRPVPQGSKIIIESEIFGPYGNVSKANRPGVRVLYHQPANTMSVHVIGQTMQCKCVFSWSRNRWLFLVFTWAPLNTLNVYLDGNRVRKGYSCFSKESKEKGPNNYRLGYELHPVAWYDMLAIWDRDRVVSIKDLKKLNTLIKDKGAETILSLSLNFPGLTWNSNDKTASSSEYTDLKQKLLNNVTFVEGMMGLKYFQNTQLVSFQETLINSSSYVRANLRINFTALRYEAVIELQEILDDMIIGGQRSEIAACSSDDNFFCSIPTEVRVGPAASATALVVRWKTFTKEFDNNGYYSHHRFVYNISSTSNGTTVSLDTLSSGKALIFGLKPYTHYCVRMAIESFKASGFFSRPECSRTIQAKPSIPPIILSAYNTSHVSIFVEWNQTIPRHGWNGILIGYQVHWGVGRKAFGLNDSFYNITTGLKPYRLYKISVSGRTIKGAGKSNSVQVRTAEWYPSNFPANIQIFNTSQTSMRVTWSDIPPEDRNGIIRGYTIEFYDMDFGNLVENITVVPTVKEREYYNLTIYNTYGVRIRGFTMVGDGPWNNLTSTVAKTEEWVPILAPSNLVGHNLSAHSILIHWYFDSNIRNVLGVLLGFRIFWNAADNEPDFKPRIINLKGEINSFQYNSLWPYTRYNLSIAAFTRMGHGVVSQSLIVRTDGEAPGLPPSSIKTYNTSSTSIHVTWGQVDRHYHHGILLGYKIVVSELLNPAVTINRTLSLGFNTTLTGLKKFTTYVIKVMAFNKYGDGEYDVAMTTTDQDVPSRPPTFVKAWNASSTSINVSWQPINDSYYEHGVLLGYLLTYGRVDGRGVVTNATVGPSSLSKSIMGLDKYVTYSITVQAFNVKGIGTASPQVFCTTDEDVPDYSPLNLGGFNISKNSIFVKWDPVPADGRNGVLLGYQLMYIISEQTSTKSSRKRRSISAGSFTAVLTPEQRSYTIPGLLPYTVYSIAIAAYTKKGVGQWSPVVLIRTNDEEPQIPPPYVTARNTSSTTINVTWLAIPPALVAGVLRSYLIKYKELDENGNNVTHRIVTVPVTQLSIELTGLNKYTNYSITVRGVTVDIGVESSPVIVRTNEDTPSKGPQNITLVRTSYSSLNVSWEPIPKPSIHGILRGLVIVYKKTTEFLTATNNTLMLPPNVTSYHVTNLEPSTNYSFWMFGYTSVGNGTATEVEYGVTDEHVPSKPPGNITAINFTSHNSINVSWYPIPHGFVHGILRGYRVLYKKVKDQGEEVSGIQMNSTVGPQDLSTMIEDMDYYAVYEIQVLGFTIKGDGVTSQPVRAETCRCSKELTTSWYMMEPYVTHNQSTSATSGLIPLILEPMVTSCCGNCYNGHGQTDINFLFDGQRNGAQKPNESQLLVQDTDLTFPVYGFHGKTSHGIYGYISLVTSPGVVFITPTEEMTAVMFQATLESWPLIALMVAMVLLAGILTWMLDSKRNPEHFPRPFIKGSYEGCWLAFISVTTVGYGDRAPKSFWARVLATANMLCGFVLISLITGNMSSDFVVTTVMADKKSLYNTKVGAITQSFEYRIAVRRNALVNTESEYYSYKDLREALISEEVQGILVDSYIVTAHPELSTMPPGSPKITRQLLPYTSKYGVALGKRTDKLDKCFNDYLKFKKNEISSTIERTLLKLTVSKESTAEEMSFTILDPSSKYFRYLYQYVGLALLTAVVAGLACTLLLRGKPSMKPLQAEQLKRVQRIRETKTMIKEFYENISSMYQDMKQRHQEERLGFLKNKLKSRKGQVTHDQWKIAS